MAGKRTWTGGLELAAASAAFVTMLIWTWRRWPDVLIDFGHQLYLAQQIAAGRVLYRDLAHFYGPLSPYLNALWFRIFGVHVLSIALANAALAALGAVLLFRLLLHIASRTAAFAGALAFILFHVFSIGSQYGNYNFIAPYSHELTHGMVLSCAVMLFLFRWTRRGRYRDLGLAGATLGLVFMTKPEVFLAAGAASVLIVAGSVLVSRTGGAAVGSAGDVGRPRARALRSLLVFAGAAAFPPILALLLLSTAMPARTALGGLLRWIPATFNGRAEGLVFYKVVSGFYEPGRSVVRMLLWSGLFALFLVPAALLAFRRSRPARGPAGSPRGLLLAGCTGFAFPLLLVGATSLRGIGPVPHLDWARAATPLPLLALFLIVLFARELARAADPGQRMEALRRLGFVLFAFALLVKTILNTSLYHYGFALAVPGVAAAVCALADWIPERTHRRGGRPAFLRAAGLGVIAAFAILHLALVGKWTGLRNASVGTGSDRFLTDDRALLVNRALAAIGRDVRPDQTLAVIPEGVMLNYLSHRVSSVRFVNWMPTELAIWGEDRMLSSLRDHPPDFIAFTQRPATEYGLRSFGADFGAATVAWIQEHYDRIGVIEGTSGARMFGRILLMKWRPAPGGAPAEESASSVRPG